MAGLGFCFKFQFVLGEELLGRGSSVTIVVQGISREFYCNYLLLDLCILYTLSIYNLIYICMSVHIDIEPTHLTYPCTNEESPWTLVTSMPSAPDVVAPDLEK